ncbi:MAG: hypothetical protein ACREPM_19495 [Gemmatimonadaceae bacterium]
MQIYPKNSGPIRPDTTQPSQPAVADSDGVGAISPTSSSVDRSYKVSISDAGRALAARDGGTDAASLDPARATQIRDRVLNGAYDTLEVVDAVARRLLHSGDM